MGAESSDAFSESHEIDLDYFHQTLEVIISIALSSLENLPLN